MKNNYFKKGSKVSVPYFFPVIIPVHESQKSEAAVRHPVMVN